MDNDLKEQLMSIFLRLRKVSSSLHEGLPDVKKYDINLMEMTLMQKIEDNTCDSNENTYMSDIYSDLFISKAAISQMIGVLEKKGYISREINKQNRRTLIVTLTPEGKNVLKVMDESLNNLLQRTIIEIGENDIKEYIRIINRLADFIDNIKNEN